MLSAGLESLPDSPVSAAAEEPHTGLPAGVSPRRMAVSEPHGGLDPESDVSRPRLACGDSWSAEHRRTLGVENLYQKTDGWGDTPKVISCGPTESLAGELLKTGDLEEDKRDKKRKFRKLDCSGNGYWKEDTEAEEYRAECCVLTPGESRSKQGDPHLTQHKVKSLRTCCTQVAGSPKNTEESQANVQVPAATLPELTEEAQGMKADGNRIFSKAGYRNDRVSKALAPESNECPDIDTVMARAGVSETSMLDFLEPLKVADIESATERPQETNEYNGLKAHTALPLRTGENVVSVFKSREEKLFRQNPVNEFSTSLANRQTRQQDEENKAHDFCTGPLPKHSEPHRLSSAESCRAPSVKSSEVLCSVLECVCYLDFRKMPLKTSRTAVHGITNETTSVPLEQDSVVRSEGLPSAKTNHREGNASHETGQTDLCFYNTSSRSSLPGSHSCLGLSTKLEEYSPETQLLEKESESKTRSEELAGNLVEATEADSNDSLSSNKEADWIHTLSVPLPPVAHKSREPHRSECPPCTVNEVSRRDKAQDNPSGKESVGASGTTGRQVVEVTLHKDKFKSSVSSRTFDNPSTTSKISQKNAKSSVGNRESVVTGLENEHSDTWNCNNQSMKDQCAAASTSRILSGSTRVDHVLPNCRSFNGEVGKKTENKDLEREASAGYNSKKAIIFPETHFPLACGSLPGEDDCGNAGGDLRGVNDISTATNMFCSAYTAEKSIATSVRDEIPNKNMESGKQFDLCKVTDVSEIVFDGDETKEQIGTCALQRDEVDKTRTADSPKAPEGNQRTKTSEQLLVRYLNKKPRVHNSGFCSSSLGPRKRELGTSKKKEVSSLTADASENSASICDTRPLLSNTNIQRQHASQTKKTLCPMENRCRARQREFHGPVPGSKQHSESLNNQPNMGLQTTATSVEETKIPIGSSQSEEILLKPGDDPPPVVHKYAREDSFQGTLKDNVLDLDSLNGVRSEDCSGHLGFVSDLIEKTIEPTEHENRCEREDKGAVEESFSDSKQHCSQHACFVKCAKEKSELEFAGNKTQQSLPKMKWLVEDQENTVRAQLLPSASIHGSLACKTENMKVFSETKTKKRLRVKSTVNKSCLQLTCEPGKETDALPGVGPSHPRKFDIQESYNETRVDSETTSALHLGISVPEKEKLCMLSENAQIDNCDSSPAEVFSKDSSVTKPLSVTTSVKRKGSNTKIASSENKTATGFVKDAKSSRACARSKGSLRDQGRIMVTGEDVTVTVQKRTRRGEQFKNTCVKEKTGREVAPRKVLPVGSLCDGEGHLWPFLEGSKESGSKPVPLSTENYEKVLEEIPGSNLNNPSKKRKNTTKLTNLAGARLLPETLSGCQTEDASNIETSPELPTFYPCVGVQSKRCKESAPNRVVCSEVCVPYELNAQSKDKAKQVTEGQDTLPTHSVCEGNEALGSERLDQIEKRRVPKRKKKREKMKVPLSDKAQPEQKSKYQEKAKITLQPGVLHSSELLYSSSNELVTSRNMKFEGPSEETFAVGSSEDKLYSTLQEVKRPKITTDIITSQLLKTQDSEMENLNLNLVYDGITGAFGTTIKPRGPLPLKIQPGRTCKKVPTSYQLKTVRKSRKMKSLPFEIPPDILPKRENTLLKSLYFPCEPPTMETERAVRFTRMPRQEAKGCSALNSLKFRKSTKEAALLSRLSAMAGRLLAPAQSIQNFKPRTYSSAILPVAERYSQRRSKNLLEAFSCINRNLHSRWADSWCTKMFSFQSLALYPAESTKILFSDLSHKPPTSFLDTQFFPISFHIKLDSSSVTDLTGMTSQRSIHHTPAWGEKPAPPSEWTLSFLLSQSCSTTAFKEDSNLDNELHSSLPITTPRAVALPPDCGRNAVAERRGGCSMLGLHTVLALSSPGCYRIWTRRRNLTSHIPTIQRLFISQFAHGVKGTRFSTSLSDELVSSLPYSLGRALSMWSQHGPSARPSEITPLHSSHCAWQPSVGIENSSAMLPHLPVQSMEALQTAGHEIRLEASFPLPFPKSCSLPEPSPPPPKLSVSELELRARGEPDASGPACLRSQDDTELKKTEPAKRPRKVSQIRIRKTIPKPDPNLTPMGLPKPKRMSEGTLTSAETASLDPHLIKTLYEIRLMKKEFSLEEIYTNKNYRSPPAARGLETIFEEPKEKNGCLISISQQKRRRVLEFQDYTLPRQRKTRGKIKLLGSFTRAKKAALQSAELDALLSQKLMELDTSLPAEDEEEQVSSI